MRVLLMGHILVIALTVYAGCSKPSTAPPTGLVKPPLAAFKAAEADILQVSEVIATVLIPKNNPTKKALTGTVEDNKLVLPELKCQIQCKVGPEKLANESFNFLIQIEAPHSGYSRMLHGMGSGSLKRLDDGTFKADVLLKQQIPLEMTDKATLVVIVRGSHKPLTSMEVKQGKVIIKQEE